MLPLISNVSPTAATSQAANAAAAQSAFKSAQSAASRSLTPMAVSAAPAALGYSPQTPEPRRENMARANAQPGAQPQSGRPSIMPDPEFWRVPDRQAAEQIAPLPARQQLIDNVQQAAQYTAQASAQEAPLAKPAAPSQNLANAKAKLNALLAKKPGIGDSTGLGAYTVAAQRHVSMGLPQTTEAIA